jgi:hypothetical protein|tara:strand:- start:1769 stop:1963 length:195 start_codon:yes stop_codon:yes gene_type:complete
MTRSNRQNQSKSNQFRVAIAVTKLAIFWFMTREESAYSQTRAREGARVEGVKALEGAIVRGIAR